MTDRLDLATLPRHVAIIMDGNGRWAKNRRLPRIAGHRAGVERVRDMVRACASNEIEVLTLFAFSSENWRRPEREVSLLMDLLMTALQQEVKKLHENNIRMRFIGDRSRFSLKLQTAISQAEAKTQENNGLTLVVAANYGGQWDLSTAMKAIAERIERREVTLDDISPELIRSHLCLPDLPEPDLFIRTGGEQRISNFLLWQLAYTELYFTDCLWPDFVKDQFALALRSFANRQRRFGCTSEQVEEVTASA